ncbi:MAG: methyl-accepting chemotaxis sensory transducer, partial [Neobacillus sp.]|nr:methyl-accepting chemotaxis sensory transducer [Neobacillus sp.]
MKWFNNLNIGKKLMISFMLIVFIAGLMGVVGIRNIKEIEMSDQQLYEVNTIPLGDLAQAAMSYQQIRVLVGQSIIETDKEKKKQYRTSIDELHNKMNMELAEFEQSIKSPMVRQEFNKLKIIQGKWSVILDEALRLIQAGDNQAAYAIYAGQGNQFSLELTQLIDRLIDLQMAHAGEKARSNS